MPYRGGQRVDRRGKIGHAHAREQGTPAKELEVRVVVFRGAGPRACGRIARRIERELHCARHREGDFVLDGEQVLQLRIELLGPDGDAGLRVHEPRSHPKLVARCLYAALEQVSHVEFPADDPQVLAAVPKRK